VKPSTRARYQADANQVPIDSEASVAVPKVPANIFSPRTGLMQRNKQHPIRSHRRRG
jgi:hypothetical protein